MQRQVKCKPYFQIRAQGQTRAWSVPKLAAAYEWPSNLPGGGIIGIVELGGGWVQPDVTAFCQANHQPVPSITDVSVDGTNNTQQNPVNDADYEVALDIEVAAASYFAATGKPATIRIYWAQDIATAVARAAADGCSVCSISWGADEANWGKVAADQMEAAAAIAAAGGTVVFAAAGDNDASDGGPGAANVDCPASCPHVVACGGTSKTAIAEVVWNNNPGNTSGEGTGGGYSTLFEVQHWQRGIPAAPHKVAGDKGPGRGRMVPDVAANADPNTGYEIVVYGSCTVVGGTSAVAPLYAGLFAAFSGMRQLGFINRKLWRHKDCFQDITAGSNGDYFAFPGPDACSGIGVPIGTALAKIFA